MMDADDTDDIAFIANIPTQAESLLHSMEWAESGIVLHVNAEKTKYMCVNQRGNISPLNGDPLNDINMRLAKAWKTNDTLSVIWKSDLTDNLKRSFFEAAVVSILLYGSTTWTLTKCMEKKLDCNCT